MGCSCNFSLKPINWIIPKHHNWYLLILGVVGPKKHIQYLTIHLSSLFPKKKPKITGHPSMFHSFFTHLKVSKAPEIHINPPASSVGLSFQVRMKCISGPSGHSTESMSRGSTSWCSRDSWSNVTNVGPTDSQLENPMKNHEKPCRLGKSDFIRFHYPES